VEQFDVWVELEPLGIPDAWAVECKDEARPLERGEVQKFRHRVENVGASKGLIVSRSGYQRGCKDVADKTNVSLFTPEEIEGYLKSEISQQRLLRLLVRLTQVLDRLRQMTKREKWPRGGIAYLPSGPGSEQYLARMAKLSFIRDQVTEILAGKRVHLAPSPEDDLNGMEVTYEVVSSPNEYCSVVEAFVEETERWSQGLSAPQ
jgi:hypothetical protein